METIIETQALTRNYRGKEAVKDLDLKLTGGRIHAFLGRNGAGKTTTIKMLTGLIRPSSGRSTLLGVDSQKLRPEDWQKIGYVSENQELYEWMTGAEIIAFTSAFYPSWDKSFERDLAEQLELPLNKKISQCSRGEKMKLALMLAMAFRPRLLILDEPFAGLDPLVRTEFLDSLLEITAQNDWSVFFSTHDIDDVEKLADEVVMIDDGQLQICESLDSLQHRFHRVDISGPCEKEPRSASILGYQREGDHIRFVHSAFNETTEAELHTAYPGAMINISSMSLKEIFLTLARKYQKKGISA